MADPVSEARALLAAATPGPWTASGADVEGPEWRVASAVDDGRRPCDFDFGEAPWPPFPRHDAALIAAAPDLLARLCDEVERARVLGPDTEARVVVEARAIAGVMMEPAIGAWRAHVAKLDAEIARLRANMYPRIGSLWRHFRAGVCRVTSLREGDDGSVIVWYTEPDGAPWVQTLDQWHERVECDGYSGPRFVEVAGE